MVSSDVRVLIEDARDNVSRRAVLMLKMVFILTEDQDTGDSNNGSETTETEQNPPMPTLLKHDSTMSGSNSRIILPLPIPSLNPGTTPLAPTASRSSTSSAATFDSVPTLTNVSTGAGPTVQSAQRLSPDSTSATRLPSITADGLLIEAGLRARSPTALHRQLDAAGSYGQDRVGALPTSPTSNNSHGGAVFGIHFEV